MDARLAYGSRPGPAPPREGTDGVQVQVQVLPEENATEEEEAQPTPTLGPGPQSGELQQQQAPYLHFQPSHTPQISNLGLPPPTDADRTVSPGRTVERLARKLSKQDLQQRHQSRTRHRQRQTKQPTPLSPASTTSVQTQAPELRRFQAWAAHDANCQSPLPPPTPSENHAIPCLPIPALGVGEPIEIDEAYVEPEQPEDRRLLDVRRPRRQTSGQLRPSARPVDHRLEGMIADGTQCNVRSEPQPILTPTPMPAPSLPKSGLQLADPGFIEPDPECATADPGIEIDETDPGDMSAFRDELLALAEGNTIPLRYAAGPGGVRKYTVGGVALRYRLSADVAMRCANVVRSRPRMRKRAKSRYGSATTSAVTSPAMSSAQSPPLPPTEFPL
ncbi:hypothetical protein CHGG_00640 [Chaetomium globosum CBS 148.51]|uniref:Uncharacterized protein n=1 Tax=Chaetomium globosum (strain ATCC 6205 / CBS 148.51 / DSM 1962 / NBRC 6347 / NRRL 1970) TaxID=306901 RepID=Q2HGL4_CHAGB|nr:uncharacterized protein CHGG_00640 [Chaetomium globosum CBS 148.51]EAQ92405.1 hypothetical protein CHGG_00640 [Chaetomium globosum CBS 148.51]